MVKKLMALSVFGVGYVLGARAGRERYDTIVTKAQELWRDPRVREKVTQTQSAAKDTARRAQDLATEKLPGSSGSAPAAGPGTVSGSTS